MTKYIYRVERTFDDSDCEKHLQNAFNEGYEFVRASEYVPEVTHNGTRRLGYIEYILRKEV